MPQRSPIYFLTLLLSYHSMATAEHIKVSETGNGSVDVKCDGELFTSYLYGYTPKPVLYPIIGPTGHGMTRDYPLKKGTPGEATDHPHHQSLWFGHGDVNGTDFWLIEEGTGKVRHDRLGKLESGPIGLIEATATWLTADGKEVCREQRTMRFATTDDARTIDLEITLTAPKEAVILGDTKEGTMAIRTRPELRLTANRRTSESVQTGHAVNSNGDRDKEVWGKRAGWVDYWGKSKGRMWASRFLTIPTTYDTPLLGMPVIMGSLPPTPSGCMTS